MSRQSLLRVLGFVAVALGAAVFVYPALPRTQHVRLHLGAGSTRVVSVRARLSVQHDVATRERGWDRETHFRFPTGAPPSVEWTFEHENGKVRLEVELTSATSTTDGNWEILLGGGETTLELVELMRGLA